MSGLPTPLLTLPPFPPGPDSQNNFGSRVFEFLRWWYLKGGPELNALITTLNALTAGDFGAASVSALELLASDLDDHIGADNPHSGSASTSALSAVADDLTAHETATSAHTAAQVGLSNVTNDAQIPLAQRGMPGGVPTLDGDGFVAQDPASAAETPGPGKIPRAGLSGLLDTWISAASTAVAGLVQLATNAVAWAGTSTSQVITAAALWYVLTLATRLRISANTTIYVSPTGSDSEGAGTAGSPYASIDRALMSIAGRSIDGAVEVVIQCADGTYVITSSIIVDHPDADKIKILGNTSAETTVAISGVNPATKIFTVAGNYVSNVDPNKNIQAGDIVGLTGDVRTVAISSISGNVFTVSSDPTTKMSIGDTIYILNGSTPANIRSYVVTGLTTTTVTVSTTIPSTTVGGAVLTATNQGAYLVSNVSYDGANTNIECSAETIASATIGGGIKIMPCNKCKLLVTGSISCFYVTAKLKLLNGFRIDHASGASTVGVNATTCDISVGGQMIFKGLSMGMQAYRGASIFAATGFVCYTCATGVNILYRSTVAANGAGLTIFNGCTTGCVANQGSYGYLYSTIVAYRNNTTNTSPALNVSGNYDSYIGG